jgi:hypothetical protein
MALNTIPKPESQKKKNGGTNICESLYVSATTRIGRRLKFGRLVEEPTKPKRKRSKLCKFCPGI